MTTTQITPTEQTQFRDNGFFITDVLFDAATLDAVQAEFQRMWDEDIAAAERGGDAKQVRLARRRPFFARLGNRSPVCAAFYRHPQLLSLAEGLIGPDADMTWDQAIPKPPSEGLAFAWHQDAHYAVNGAYGTDADHQRLLDTEGKHVITVWVAITPATVENGTLWVAPGQHRAGLLPHLFDEDRAEWQCQFDHSGKTPAVLERGQAVVFNTLLPHASGANVSNEVRMAYQLAYAVPGVINNGNEIPVLRDGHAV